MKRLQDGFLNIIDEKIILKDKNILEIGCGEGERSLKLSKRCEHLTAIDPNNESLQKARQNNASDNLLYQLGEGQELHFDNNTFDAVIFTLSLHHVPIAEMAIAIKEAFRVTKNNGFLIFLEPSNLGTFIRSEIMFDTGDGDERKEKAYAYYTLLNAGDSLEELYEIYDETVFQFDSYKAFVEEMKPKKNVKKLKAFLEENNYTLNAQRRINIFRILKPDSII